MRRRLDAELVRRGLAPSRGAAVEAVRAGLVTVGGAPADNPARLVDDATAVHVLGPARRYVSRGGEKLAHALDVFAIDPSGRRWLDAGASTGGFTDCLLQRGAREVVAVDVGHGQLAWSLRTDERVVVLERTNVRDLEASTIGGRVDGCVADLSFISLAVVAPALVRCVDPGGDFVLLVKPQFEAGRDRVGKGGVVRDPQVHAAVCCEVVADLAGAGLGVVGFVASPLLGADGNREFLAHARAGAAPLDADAVAEVALAETLPSSAGPSGQNAG